VCAYCGEIRPEQVYAASWAGRTSEFATATRFQALRAFVMSGLMMG
jgi:hypothetical protein